VPTSAARVLPVLLAYGAAAVTPGASVIVVARSSLAGGRGEGARTALGVALGTALYATASLFGLSALVAGAPGLLRVVSVGGGLYLGFVGLKLALLRPGARFDGAAAADQRGGAFGRGLLTNLSNPHTVVFFLGIFGAMLGPGVPGAERAVVLSAVIAMSVTWYTSVALGLSSARAQALYERASRLIDLAAGAALVALSLKLLLPALRQ
jgi:threonine/homoserine/homoserine lactone efflux protein